MPYTSSNPSQPWDFLMPGLQPTNPNLKRSETGCYITSSNILNGSSINISSLYETYPSPHQKFAIFIDNDETLSTSSNLTTGLQWCIRKSLMLLTSPTALYQVPNIFITAMVIIRNLLSSLQLIGIISIITRIPSRVMDPEEVSLWSTNNITRAWKMLKLKLLFLKI